MQQYTRVITGGNQPDKTSQEEIVTDPKTGTRYRVAKGKRYVIVEPAEEIRRNAPLSLTGISFDTPAPGSLLGKIGTPNVTNHPTPYTTPKSFTPKQAPPPVMSFSTAAPRRFTKAENAPETFFTAKNPTSPESKKYAAAVEAARWLGRGLPENRPLTKYEQDRILSDYAFEMKELENKKLLSPEWSQRPIDNNDNYKIDTFGSFGATRDREGRPATMNQFLPKMGSDDAHKTAKNIDARIVTFAMSVPTALIGTAGAAGAGFLAREAGLSGLAEAGWTALGGMLGGAGGTLLTDRTARAFAPEWMRDLDEQRAQIQKEDPFGYAMLEASGNLVGGAGGKYGVDAGGRLVSGGIGAAMDQAGRLLRGEGFDLGTGATAFITNAMTHSSGGALDEAAENAGRLTAKGGVAAGKQVFRYGNAALDALVTGTKTNIRNGQLYASIPGGIPGVGFDVETFLRSLKGGKDFPQAEIEKIAAVIRERGELPVTPSVTNVAKILRKDPEAVSMFASWDRARRGAYAPRFEDEYSIVPLCISMVVQGF